MISVKNLCGADLCTNVAACSYNLKGRRVFICRDHILSLSKETGFPVDRIGILLPDFAWEGASPERHLRANRAYHPETYDRFWQMGRDAALAGKEKRAPGGFQYGYEAECWFDGFDDVRDPGDRAGPDS